jgi:hypothetical protein
MSDDTSRQLRALRGALEKYAAAAEALFERGPMLPGTIYDTARRCGNPGCRCARGELHPQMVLKLRHERSNRGLSAAVRERLEPLVTRYKRFRAARSALQAAHRDVIARVDEIELALTVEPTEGLLRGEAKA